MISYIWKSVSVGSYSFSLPLFYGMSLLLITSLPLLKNTKYSMHLWPLTNALMWFYVHCLFQLMIFVQISIIKFIEAFMIETSFQNSSCLFAWDKSLFIRTSKNIIILFSSHPQHDKDGQDDFYTRTGNFFNENFAKLLLCCPGWQ